VQVLQCDLSPTSHSSLSSDDILEQVNTLDSIDLSWSIPHTPKSSIILQHDLLSDDFVSARGTSLNFGGNGSKLSYKTFTSLPNQFFYWEWPTGTPASGTSYAVTTRQVNQVHHALYIKYIVRCQQKAVETCIICFAKDTLSISELPISSNTVKRNQACLLCLHLKERMECFGHAGKVVDTYAPLLISNLCYPCKVPYVGADAKSACIFAAAARDTYSLF
jgi:hypothetical protein